MHHENFNFKDETEWPFVVGCFLALMIIVGSIMSFGFFIGQLYEREKISKTGELCDSDGQEVVECRKLGDIYMSVKE